MSDKCVVWFRWGVIIRGEATSADRRRRSQTSDVADSSLHSPLIRQRRLHSRRFALSLLVAGIFWPEIGRHLYQHAIVCSVLAVHAGRDVKKVLQNSPTPRLYRHNFHATTPKTLQIKNLCESDAAVEESRFDCDRTMEEGKPSMTAYRDTKLVTEWCLWSNSSAYKQL